MFIFWLLFAGIPLRVSPADFGVFAIFGGASEFLFTLGLVGTWGISLVTSAEKTSRGISAPITLGNA